MKNENIRDCPGLAAHLLFSRALLARPFDFYRCPRIEFTFAKRNTGLSVARKMLSQIFRGAIVRFVSHKLDVLPDAVIGVSLDGTIKFVEDSTQIASLQSQYKFADADITRLAPFQFLMPGFIDCHIHAPQYSNCGVGVDKELLDWLTTYTFPEGVSRCLHEGSVVSRLVLPERKYADPEYARKKYPTVVKRSVAHHVPNDPSY
jgi:guanine deaminase